MSNILEAVLLGLVQGITEWLPISSSGHLVLLQTLFGIEQPLVFDVVLHLGSLLVVLLVFRKDLLALLKGIVRMEERYLWYAFYLGIATVPIGVVGVFLNEAVKSAFSSARCVGFSLLFTALLLHLSQYAKEKKERIGLKNAVFIGIAQGLAILPGVSRSGSTISVAMMAGVEREEAARFSFLMFIPAILGAAFVEIGEIRAVTDVPAMLAGLVAAVVAGYLSLRWLLKIIKEGNFGAFKWYCLGLGAIVLLFLG